MATTKEVVRRTTSHTGTLYFAYGSNLSAHQMQHRCTDSPATSAQPVAVARLDGWKWVICQRGYANIVPLDRDLREDLRPDLKQNGSGSEVEVWNATVIGGGGGGGGGRTGKGGGSANTTTTTTTGDPLEDGDEDSKVVWGILYNMTPGDERVLDAYEGHDEGRNPRPVPNRDPDPERRARRPEVQGDWDYNKWYIDVTVAKWLQPPSVLGLDQYPDQNVVKVLTYVDELRTSEGRILKNYVGRMNRAIEEGVELGVPRRWVDRVMRRWVVPGVFPERGYVGTNEGYVPEEETEAEVGGEVV